jgi:hypothetical protein
MSSDRAPVASALFQRPHSKCVTQIVYPRSWQARAIAQADRTDKLEKHGLNRVVTEATPIGTDKEVWIAGADLASSGKITPQRQICGLMQRYQSVFAELGCPDDKTVGSKVVEIQGNCLGDSQSCCREQCE